MNQAVGGDGKSGQTYDFLGGWGCWGLDFEGNPAALKQGENLSLFSNKTVKSTSRTRCVFVFFVRILLFGDIFHGFLKIGNTTDFIVRLLSPH